jgi:hypothetical protein
LDGAQPKRDGVTENDHIVEADRFTRADQLAQVHPRVSEARHRNSPDLPHLPDFEASVASHPGAARAAIESLSHHVQSVIGFHDMGDWQVVEAGCGQV